MITVKDEFEFNAIGIYAYIVRERGRRFKCHQIAHRMGRSTADTKALLQDLEAAGKIEVSVAGCERVYFVRTEQEEQILQKLQTQQHPKPYNPNGGALRAQHQYILERLADFRAIPSLF